MGVFSGVEQRHIKFRGGDFAVGHGDVGLEMSDFGAWLAQVHPLDILVLDDTTGQTCAVAFGDGFWEDERTRCDVEVFFFLGVNPFNNALNDERAEVDFTTRKFRQVILGQTWSTVVKDEQRS